MQKYDSTAEEMLTNSADQAVEKIKRTADLKALFKTGIIQSNVMTALAGFLLALYQNQLQLNDYWLDLFLMLIGSALVIAGGSVLNNYYDRDIDLIMIRTQKRPTVTGTMSLTVILLLGILLSIVGVIFLFITSWQAAFFGFLGWFAYVVLYTMWSKRRYTLNTAVGSLSGAVPPLIGWSAVDPDLSIMAFALFVLIFVWQTPHFLALAIKKKDEYQAANIPMLPVVYGFDVTKRQIIFYIICLLPIPFFLYELGLLFFLLASGLNIGWLMVSLKGIKKQDTYKWANKVFVYSLFYLMIIFISIIIFTLPSII
ncbi:heme o synthase [Paraliobacillus sp. JSM ZJ581]|uniref:heme o synthase n=1 Tax=Paraliobacillus sp. JSM ZJ581 TaxID=3342118 RepID=UPI0035A87824